MSGISIVKLTPERNPTAFSADTIVDSFERDGEEFRRSFDFGEWLGFYDWLRTDEGQVVGVRISPDDEESKKLFERFAGSAVVIANGTVSIRTVMEGSIVEALSDDAEFGGNKVFFGNAGSLAVAFFSPSPGIKAL